MNPTRDTGARRRLLLSLIERWYSLERTRLTLRPVQVQDAPALRDMIESLSFRDRHCRFHGAVNGISPAQLLDMVSVDRERHLGLVVTAEVVAAEVAAAETPRGETVVADARYVVDDSGRGAELAIVVAESWRRCGIGGRAIAALQRGAAHAGLDWLHASVLADNKPMLGLLRACRFRCTPSRYDKNLVVAEIRVETRAADSSTCRAGIGSGATPQPWRRFARLAHLSALAAPTMNADSTHSAQR